MCQHQISPAPADIARRRWGHRDNVVSETKSNPSRKVAISQHVTNIHHVGTFVAS